MVSVLPPLVKLNPKIWLAAVERSKYRSSPKTVSGKKLKKAFVLCDYIHIVLAVIMQP